MRTWSRSPGSPSRQVRKFTLHPSPEYLHLCVLDVDDSKLLCSELEYSELDLVDKFGAEVIHGHGVTTDLVEKATRSILEHFRRHCSATDEIFYLMNDKTLRSFVRSRNPSVLLIRDAGNPRERDYLAVSFIAANLVRRLCDGAQGYPDRQVYTLAFFCKIAASFRQPRNARNIMVQLVSQLMLQCRGPTLSVPSYDLENICNEDTDRLLTLLEQLVLHLPPKSQVYCIIDAFNSKAAPENDKILKSLLDLSKQSFSRGIIMKVLFTCSKSTVGFRRHLSAGEVLDIGLSKRRGAKRAAHMAMHQFHHTAVGKMLEDVLVR